MDKIITTILSFDDLLFTASVRQVVPELPAGVVSPLESNSKQQPGQSNEKQPLMSMSNPLYEAPQPSGGKLAAAASGGPLKYHTKIDAGIRVNDLTQEVNMPLLRLVHQIYSIIADAIEYDKEQMGWTKSAATATATSSGTAANMDSKLSSFRTTMANNPAALTAHNQLVMNAQNFANNSRDCWRYMAGLIELKEFLPEPKPVEKVYISFSFTPIVSYF